MADEDSPGLGLAAGAAVFPAAVSIGADEHGASVELVAMVPPNAECLKGRHDHFQ